MNVLTVIDYYLQYVESGEPQELAAERALKFLKRFEADMSIEEYKTTQEVINRMSKI